MRPSDTHSIQVRNSEVGRVRQNTPFAPFRKQATTASLSTDSNKRTMDASRFRARSARAKCMPFLGVESSSALIRATKGLLAGELDNKFDAGATTATSKRGSRARD